MAMLRIADSPAQPYRGAVCIVSDDPAIRRSLSILLRLEGHDVTVADMLGTTPWPRVAWVSAQRCCLLIDDRRPRGRDSLGSDGLGLAECLARRGHAAPIVLLADLPDDAFRRRASAARVVAVLEKPVLADIIVLTVARALDGNGPAPQPAA